MEQLFQCVVEKKLRLPLYFCWGAIDDEPRVLIPRVLKETHLYPDHREIAHLRQLPGRVAYSPWGWREEARVYFSSPAEFNSTPTEAVASSEPPTASVQPPAFPPVERYSGQKEGEDVHTFFARRAERNKKWTRSERPDARSSRLAREAHAAEGGPPGKKGARVFVWEEQEGFLIRKSVNRINAADMWDEYTPNQRRYDGFSNEWDLCHEFAPDEDAGADDEGQHSTANDLRQMYNLNDLDEQPGSEADLYEPYHDMKEIPPFRFGFTEPVAAANYQGTLRSDMVARSVGDEKWPDLRLPKYSLLPVFLAQLLKAESIQDVPRELLDLRQDQADILEPWAVDVERKFLDQQLFYIVRPNTLPDNKDLRILLQSAATTLQIVRMGWGTLPEIVAELLARGIKFQVCVQAPVYREPVLSQRGTRLGYRPSGYRPTAVDYAAYQHRLDAYLHSSRGRAALCTGGVIGRLAREIVPDALVAIGPSDEVFDTGLRLWDGQGQTAYWDDSLTADEIDLICGVYIVATGMAQTMSMCGINSEIFQGSSIPQTRTVFRRRKYLCGRSRGHSFSLA
ncbi:hypothetical protein DFH06DRAFT_1024353 [Mycena polygramma]|nr:hypothetical protein DFH06DRAFT_1024353 [Mycena polygramma]